LNEPQKTVSSATVTFACMESWIRPGAHGAESLPGKAPPSSTCARSSTRSSAMTSASVPRMGPAVRTGSRCARAGARRAAPIALAMRRESCSPRPGQNHARAGDPATSTGGTSKSPVPWTRPEAQISSKSRA
jgi:hypothetical protein